VARQLNRLGRRLARKHTRRVRAPPPDQLRAEAKILHEIAPDDPKVIALCNAVEQMIADGYTLREGGPEPRRWPLHEAWGGKEPPEPSK
jgi:hypothetical protein